MTKSNALKVLADFYGIRESEPLSVIFDILYNHEDDSLLLPELPGTAENLAGKTGIPVAKAKEELDRLAYKGAVFKLPSGEYVLPRILLELRDATMVWPELPDRYFIAWQNLIESDYPTALLKQRETGYVSRSKTLPVNETAPSESRVLEHNSLRKIIRDAKVITTVPCPCRRQLEISGNRPSDCPAGDQSFCIQTGAMAQTLVDRGIATVLTTEEALERIDEAAKAGLVHNVTDFMDDYEIAKEIGMSICNCCPCCCILLYSVFKGFPEIVKKSGFQPTLDENACTGCGGCEDRCVFNAISANGFARFDLGKCLGCGNCVLACPEKAIIMESSAEIRS